MTQQQYQQAQEVKKEEGKLDFYTTKGRQAFEEGTSVVLSTQELHWLITQAQVAFDYRLARIK